MRLALVEDLDEFLEGAGSGTAVAERYDAVGSYLSMSGIVVAVGLVVFLLGVHRGTRSEVESLTRGLSIVGAVAVVGAVIELAATVSVVAIGPGELFTSGLTMAPTLRLLGGSLVLAGAAIDAGSAETRAGGAADRWTPGVGGTALVLGAAIGVASFAFDGHSVTEGPRFLHAAVGVIHVVGAGVWVGGLLGVMLVWRRRRSAQPVGPLIVRFSGFATFAVVAVSLAGAAMAAFILDEPGDLLGTDWGRLLLVKLGLVAVVGSIGAYNHFVSVPAIERDPGDAPRTRRALRLVSVEAGVLSLVLLVTVALTTASPG